MPSRHVSVDPQRCPIHAARGLDDVLHGAPSGAAGSSGHDYGRSLSGAPWTRELTSAPHDDRVPREDGGRLRATRMDCGDASRTASRRKCRGFRSDEVTDYALRLPWPEAIKRPK